MRKESEDREKGRHVSIITWKGASYYAMLPKWVSSSRGAICSFGEKKLPPLNPPLKEIKIFGTHVCLTSRLVIAHCSYQEAHKVREHFGKRLHNKSNQRKRKTASLRLATALYTVTFFCIHQSYRFCVRSKQCYEVQSVKRH